MAKFGLKGAIINYGSAGGAPASDLGQVRSGSCDFGQTNLVETTVIADTRKTFTPGTMEPLSFEVEVVWDPSSTGHGAAMTAYLAQTLVSAGITWPDTGAGAVYSDGYWTNVTAPVQIDNAMTATFAFQGTGAPTFTP